MCDTCLPKLAILPGRQTTPLFCDWVRIYTPDHHPNTDALELLVPDPVVYPSGDRMRIDVTGKRLTGGNERQVMKTGRIMGKITRVDFAVDIMEALHIEQIYDVWCENHKNVTIIENAQGGNTVNLGKRSSQRFIRVYDKRAEILIKDGIDIGFDLTRVELEVKKDAVENYCLAFLSDKRIIANDIQHRTGIDISCVGQPVTVSRMDNSDDWRFIARYKKILGKCYKENSERFLSMIGARGDD